jgi:hypothetical protein
VTRQSPLHLDTESLRPYQRLPLPYLCAEHRMFDQDFCAKKDQTDAAKRLGDTAKFLAEQSAHKNADGCHRQCRGANRESHNDNVYTEEREANSDGHGVNTGANRRHQKCAD